MVGSVVVTGELPGRLYLDTSAICGDSLEYAERERSQGGRLKRLTVKTLPVKFYWSKT